MSGYTVALSIHLLSLLVATAAMAITSFAGFRLRAAGSTQEAESWIGLIERAVRAFPGAVIGLLVTGAYMVHEQWTWSTPWVDAALVGLGLIVVLGTGVERYRMRALQRSLAVSGMSVQTRRLLRDPVSWTAKMTIPMLVVAVMFVMTTKPAAFGCATSIGIAVLVGAAAAMPMWRVVNAEESDVMESTSSPE